MDPSSSDTRPSSEEHLLPSCSSTAAESSHPPPPPHNHIAAEQPPPSQQWQHQLGASFSRLSDQFKDVSRTLSSLAPPVAQEDHDGPPPAACGVVTYERMARIEDKQRELEAELQELREHLHQISAAASPNEPGSPPTTASFEEQLKEHIAQYILDQERLPGRLQNALATKSLSPLKMLPMKDRKIPPNSPNTRGEFEHLTKERYEGLMKCYDIPISGDTAAKRETLRAFLGIPSIPLGKK